jgi:FkbM family methyltransferase
MRGLVKGKLTLSETYTSPAVRIVQTHVLGQSIKFAVDQPRDAIQAIHALGRFYEADELLLMSKVFPMGGRFLDVGANVGNHSIFFGKFMRAQSIVPIEVNPRVIGLLKTNLMINGLEEVADLSHLGVGLHNETLSGAAINYRERNIGGGRLSYEGGDLTLVRGDEILEGPFDLVKIDVEGSEICVLEGLEGLVAQSRPKLFVEVENENAEDFLGWAADHDYRVSDRFKRYRRSENYLIVPT